MHDPKSRQFVRDGLVSLFHADPRLAFDLYERASGHVLGPNLEISSEPTDFVDPHDPARTHRTDVVFVAHATRGGARVAVMGLALEILVEIDRARPPGWAIYPEGIRLRHGCPGQVLILSPDPVVRGWAQAERLVRHS